MTRTQNPEVSGADQALEPGSPGAGGAAGPSERIAALLRRHGSDLEFRAAVDDMAAAAGLSLLDCSLGCELDDVVRLARHMREQAGVEARRCSSSSAGAAPAQGGTRH